MSKYISELFKYVLRLCCLYNIYVYDMNGSKKINSKLCN